MAKKATKQQAQFSGFKRPKVLEFRQTDWTHRTTVRPKEVTKFVTLTKNLVVSDVEFEDEYGEKAVAEIHFNNFVFEASIPGLKEALAGHPGCSQPIVVKQTKEFKEDESGEIVEIFEEVELPSSTAALFFKDDLPKWAKDKHKERRRFARGGLSESLDSIYSE